MTIIVVFNVLQCDICETIWMNGVKLTHSDEWHSHVLEMMEYFKPDMFRVEIKNIDGEEWDDWATEEDRYIEEFSHE